MANHPPRVVYDILRDGIGLAPVVIGLVILAGFGILCGLILRDRRRGRPAGGGLIVLGLYALMGGWGLVNPFYQHFRCVALARSGQFDVTAGRVTNFFPMPPWPRNTVEQFTVGGFTFSYGNRSIGDGGFRYAFGRGGLLRDGVRVRVAHRRGRILRLEILGE